ncbi:uncharacterized protein LOC105913922 [Setaria italica]|uniref:uncharacterized protein LOC105913922 n=1 Tax=Setaria italica TaxID=4555 RepID=UPI000BE4ED83|nr:uncharacterized protein LOC105913922 [Setaria italica]
MSGRRKKPPDGRTAGVTLEITVPGALLGLDGMGKKMAAPAYPLLESAYDLQHRAHHLGDLNEDLKPLRARVHSPLRWDERYAEYLQRVASGDSYFPSPVRRHEHHNARRCYDTRSSTGGASSDGNYTE